MSTRTLGFLAGLAIAALGLHSALGQNAEPPKASVGAAADARIEALVRGIKVLPDKAPDCSSLKSIAESVTRECKTNDEKAIAIYNFMQLSHYHRAYAGEPGGGLPALKEIVCYGWGLCGGLHSVQSALWRELGWGWRFIGWPGHTTVEAQYDGRWHYIDVFLKIFAWMPDGKGGRTLAGEYDLKANPKELLQDAFVMDKARNVAYMKSDQFVMIDGKANWRAHDFLSCGDTLDKMPNLNRVGPSESWAGYDHATGSYSTDVNLAPGFALTNTWDAVPDAWWWYPGAKGAPAHTCPGHKDTRNDPGYGLVLEPYVNSKPARSYANGALTFAPDFSNDAFLKALVSIENAKVAGKALVPAEAGRAASIVFRLASPYIMTKASGEAAGADTVEVSVDDGKTFKAVDIKNFTDAVKVKLAALVRVTFKESLKSLRIEAIVQNNPGALPYLSPGKNTVTVSVADPKALGENKLVVTYAYRLGSRASSFDQLCAKGKRVANQSDAKWADAVTCVQKTFTAKDLPATFEINCPTPKGQYPVYPRMVFVRREVIAPASSPMPLPDGAVEAKVGPDDELASLPNPFLVGCPPAGK